MKKLIAIALFVGLAIPVFAGDMEHFPMNITMTGTNAAATFAVTNTGVQGHINEVILMAAAGTTGSVTVLIDPIYSTNAANVTLVGFTNLNGTTRYRPRFDATDTAGTALTNDQPERWLCLGENIIFQLTNASATNLTFECVIKYETWSD